MTPELFQHLIDQLDQNLAGAQPQASTPASPEAEQERKVLSYALDAIRYNALNDQVRKALQEVKAAETPVVSITPIRRLAVASMKIAAGLAILLCLGGLGKFALTGPGTVYDAYYAPYEIGMTRGVETLTNLEQAYQAKDWASVNRIFLETGSTTPKDNFLAGMASMEQANFTQAISQFKALQHLNQGIAKPSYQDESDYYLAMAYLANHQAQPALILLNKIKADSDHLFHRKVMQMSALDLTILRAK